MFSESAQAVSDLAEGFLELVEILIEDFVEASHRFFDGGQASGFCFANMPLFSGVSTAVMSYTPATTKSRSLVNRTINYYNSCQP